ncbi:MAG: TonB-dependent receptor [Pseudomonadales bacterium]|nr:TonB-dependent receptor [Pseudomonadales bacterium]
MKHRLAAVIGLAVLASPFQFAAADRVIEEVVVTATKRAESVQDVPIAVSAFRGEDLESRGVQDLYGLQEVSPSISVYSSNSTSNGGTVRIRGVGTTGNNPGLEAAVGTFIDGVYRSRAGQAFSDLVDIERIEILRGPQGSLFGKNTSAGALHIITKKPEFEQAIKASITGGDFDLIKGNASFTGPISETVAYRLAVSFQQRDGYYEDDVTGDAYDQRDRYSIKGQLLFQPTDSFESRLMVDFTDKSEDCCPAVYEFSNLTNPGNSSTRRIPYTTGENVGLIVNDLLAAQGRPLQFANFPEDNYDVGLNFKPFEEVEDWGVQNEATWNISDDLKLVSITAYREFDVERGQDPDFSGADILQPQFTEESFENFSQEFQLSFATENVDYLVGAYIYTEDIDTNESIRLASQGAEYLSRYLIGTLEHPQLGNLGLGLSDLALAQIIGRDITRGAAGIGTYDQATDTYISDGSARANFQEGDGYTADFSQRTEGWSLFTHNVWHITDQWALTIGARYSNETKEAKTRINNVEPGELTDEALLTALLNDDFNEDHCTGAAESGALCNNASWKDESTEREWTGTIKLSFAVTEDINIYTSFSRGYKAGGFNLDQQAIEFDSFATYLATGAVAEFLDPVVDPLANAADIPQSVLDATNGTGRNGLSLADAPSGCGQQGGTITPGITDLECSFIDDDHQFDPEFVDAYEIGIKSKLFDGALTANVALFYSDFEDFQLNTYTGTGFLISNTDQMISKGVEIETNWYIGDNIIWSFGVTYADARYGDDLNKKNTSEAQLFLDQDFETLEDFQSLENIEGQQITHAPRWQGSTSLFVEQPIGQFIGYGNLNVGFRGKHNTGSDLDEEKNVSDKAIINLQLGVRSEDDKWDVQIWARNLADKQVDTVIFDSVFQNGSYSTFLNPPRMIGITVTSNLM